MRDARLAAMAVVFSGLGLIGCGSSGLAQVATATPEQAAVQPEPSARPKMDMVFVLDTTGSMSGLIAGAKAKIWEIARRAQEGKPAPELRIGLVAYRDVGDAYVTKVVPLSGDLDAIYANLSDFTAAGGGDEPEHVLKGLHDAIYEMPWSADRNAVKLIYLVGDAPPHFDYQDGITLQSVLSGAAQKGVRISALRCGTSQSALAAFGDIARPTDGEVATIEQDGGVVATVTPHDAELARLNAELAATEVHYGSAAERAEAAKVVERNLAAPDSAQADRASYYGARAAGAVKGPTKKDLVAAAPKAVASLSDAELPEELRKMTPAERQKFLEDKRKQREAVLAKVQKAAAAREEYLKKAAPKPAASAFDSKVYGVMKKAAEAKGIAY
jgi:Mg-chelatase subunit ChlD